VLRAKRNSYLLKLLKTRATLCESIGNLESVVPVGSLKVQADMSSIGIHAGPTRQVTGVDAVKLEV
jgi:hypothetical protein